jgi:hypothetical protein
LKRKPGGDGRGRLHLELSSGQNAGWRREAGLPFAEMAGNFNNQAALPAKHGS